MPPKTSAKEKENKSKPNMPVEEPAVPKELEFLDSKKLTDHIRQNIHDAFVEHIAKALHANIALFVGSANFRLITLEVILDCLHQVAPRWRPLTHDNFEVVSK